MNEPATVTYDLAEVLKRIEDKIDSNQQETNEKFKDLSKKIDKQSEEIGEIKVKLVGIETEVKNLNKDVTELKGSTKAQIWTLIGILVTAVSGFLVALYNYRQVRIFLDAV